MDSDHNLVITKCSLSFNITKKATRQIDVILGSYRESRKRKIFQKAVMEELGNIGDSGVGGLNGRWKNAEDILETKTRAAKKLLMDWKILKLMYEEIKYKNAKDKQVIMQYVIETLLRTGKVDAAHRESKDNFRERPTDATIVRDKNGKASTEGIKNIVNRW